MDYPSSSINNGKIWLSALLQLYRFAANQRRLESVEDECCQTSFHLKHHGNQSNSTNITIETPKVCEVVTLKRFLKDDFLPCLEEYCEDMECYFEMTIESLDSTSKLPLKIYAKPGKIEEIEIYSSQTNVLRIMLMFRIQEHQVIRLIEAFQEFLIVCYLVERKEFTLVDYEVGDVSSRKVFRNDASNGFCSVGNYRFISNMSAYAVLNPGMALIQSQKLCLIPSRRTKIPGSNFNLILACAKFLKDESQPGANQSLTVLAFSSEKLPLSAMPASESNIVFALVEKMKRHGKESGLNFVIKTENRDDTSGIVFNITVDPTHHKTTRLYPEDTLLIISIQCSRTPQNDDSSPSIATDPSWNDSAIKWVLNNLASVSRTRKKKVGSQTELQSNLDGICRGFADIVQNTTNKHFQRLCLDITKAKTVEEFGGKIQNYLELYAVSRHNYSQKEYLANHKPMSDFESLQLQLPSGVESVGGTQAMPFAPKWSMGRTECSKPSQASPSTAQRRAKRNGPPPAVRKRVYDNVIAIAKPQKEFFVSGDFSENAIGSLYRHGIPMDSTVMDGKILPQTMRSDSTKVPAETAVQTQAVPQSPAPNGDILEQIHEFQKQHQKQTQFQNPFTEEQKKQQEHEVALCQWHEQVQFIEGNVTDPKMQLQQQSQLNNHACSGAQKQQQQQQIPLSIQRMNGGHSPTDASLATMFTVANSYPSVKKSARSNRELMPGSADGKGNHLISQTASAIPSGNKNRISWTIAASSSSSDRIHQDGDDLRMSSPTKRYRLDNAMVSLKTSLSKRGSQEGINIFNDNDGALLRNPKLQRQNNAILMNSVTTKCHQSVDLPGNAVSSSCANGFSVTSQAISPKDAFQKRKIDDESSIGFFNIFEFDESSTELTRTEKKQKFDEEWMAVGDANVPDLGDALDDIIVGDFDLSDFCFDS